MSPELQMARSSQRNAGAAVLSGVKEDDVSGKEILHGT